MTAINVVRTSDRVHVVCDGRGLAPSETVRSFSGLTVATRVTPARAIAMSKVATFPHLNLALGIRGQAFMIPHVAAMVPVFGKSFDEIRASLASGFRNWWTGAAAQWGRAGADARMTSADLIFAGISEEIGGPASYMVATHEFYGDAIPPWQPVDLPEVYLSPGDQATFERFAEPPDDIDAFAIASLKHQRDLELRGPAGETFQGRREIGVFAQVTTVSRHAITSRIVHRWPGEV